MQILSSDVIILRYRTEKIYIRRQLFSIRRILLTKHLAISGG